MQPCLASRYLHSGAQLLAEALHQGVSTFGIDRSHPANVAREMTFPNEIGEHQLVQGWGTYVHGKSDSEEAVDQVRRQNYVA